MHSVYKNYKTLSSFSSLKTIKEVTPRKKSSRISNNSKDRSYSAKRN